MIRIKTNVNEDHLERNDLYEEYRNKLKEIKINLVDPDDINYGQYISTCIIIPLEDLSVIVKIHGIDETGKIKYYILGYVKSEEFSNEYITLVHASLGEDEIYSYDKIYEVLDGNYKSFNREEWVMNLETIHKICNAIMHQYLCNRGTWRDDSREGDAVDGMDIEDYLLYMDF